MLELLGAFVSLAAVVVLIFLALVVASMVVLVVLGVLAAMTWRGRWKGGRGRLGGLSSAPGTPRTTRAPTR